MNDSWRDAGERIYSVAGRDNHRLYDRAFAVRDAAIKRGVGFWEAERIAAETYTLPLEGFSVTAFLDAALG